MNKHFEHLISQAGNDRLSSAERAKMRHVLSEYMAFKPLPAQSATLLSRHAFGEAFYMSIRRPFAVALAALLVITGGSGGIAYAAEDALPGDVLYPVKVGIVEPARTALNTTPETQAAWQMALAERRLNEAATLAVKDKLSPATEARLEEAFAARVDAAASAVNEAEAKDPSIAAAARATFSARLSGYETVLARAGTKHRLKDVVALRAKNFDPRNAQAHESIALKATASISMAASISPNAAPPAPSAASAAKVGEAALQSLRQTNLEILAASSTISASSSVSAHRALEAAERTAAHGKQLLEANDTQGAQDAFEDSLKRSGRLEVLTHAASSLNLNTLDDSPEN